MNPVGPRIASTRTSKKLTQAQLAEEVGVSQATISRLETSSEEPEDLRLIIKIAKSLECHLSDLIAGSSLETSLRASKEDEFTAFCPNPLCRLNENGKRRDGGVFVRWDSSKTYPASEFHEVNFCGSCGEELVKACPECGLRLGQRRQEFCVRCGKRLCDRPTATEWDVIREMNSIDDDIPF